MSKDEFNYVIIPMRKFSNTDDSKKRSEIKGKFYEILMFIIEILLSILPLLIVFLISLIVNSNITVHSLFLDGELIWFSITTLLLLNLKNLVNNKNRRNEIFNLILNSTTLLCLLLYTGIYIFIKLNNIDIIQIENINQNLMLTIIFVFTIITVIINITSIIINGGVNND